jgi:multidrug efflux pump subunit AcrA (membrane-fusion protein)
MAKKWKILIFAGIAVVVAAVLMGSLRSRDRNAPRVTTAKVEIVDLVAKVTANGKIQARKKVDMSALVMGQIVNLAVQEGDKVKKGQLLLQIDKTQLAAAAQGSEASLAAMKHDLDAARANAEQARMCPS